MRRIVRGLSIGYLLASFAFGAAIFEHHLLVRGVSRNASLHVRAVDIVVPKTVPLRGSQDIDAPLLLPFEAPQAPRKPAPHRRKGLGSNAFAALPLLDTGASAG